MIMHRALLLAATLALPAAPVVAGDADSVMAPAQSATERGQYREIFAAIRSSDWSAAAAKIDAMPAGPLADTARAELYLAKGSPRVEVDALMTLLTRAPDLPQAEQLARLAAGRGASSLPSLPETRPLVWQGTQPRRTRAKSVRGDPVADRLDPLIQPLIVDDRPLDAETLLIEQSGNLSSDARTEFQQRIAWSYYLVSNDNDALRLAEQARIGTGEWAVQGAWVSGLASWRKRDCKASGEAFASVASRASDVELMAAGHYWAARSDMMCGHPERVQARLRSASRLNETFYGLLAASALGLQPAGNSGLHNYRDSEWRSIARRPNVQAAVALAGIGENDLADQYIRHQAKIGPAGEHDALVHLAADLNLASTQFWLAHNAPRGASLNVAARYPRPDWKPVRGWRVEQSLLFAHALQELNFRTNVVSPAGAQGLMQVRPGTAGDIARSRGEAFDRQQLNDPVRNIEFGQSYIEGLRDSAATGGLLPKVIAAYNAGPVPIAEWNMRRADGGDPLLYIESIPYWETRGYVPSVLRNYWIYDAETGKTSASRSALAQGMWPRFPGLAGPRAVRIDHRPEAVTYRDE